MPGRLRPATVRTQRLGTGRYPQVYRPRPERLPRSAPHRQGAAEKVPSGHRVRPVLASCTCGACHSLLVSPRRGDFSELAILTDLLTERGESAGGSETPGPPAFTETFSD